MLGFWWLRRSLSLYRMIQSLRVRAVSVEYFHLATYILCCIDLNYCAEFITEVSFFCQTLWEDPGKNHPWSGNAAFCPPSHRRWIHPYHVFELTVHQFSTSMTVVVGTCFCVWMSPISVLRGGCVCLTNRNNSIPKSMDSTSTLFQGSRYTCCLLHSWPFSFPSCFSSFFRLMPHHLKLSVAFHSGLNHLMDLRVFRNHAAGVLPLYA